MKKALKVLISSFFISFFLLTQGVFSQGTFRIDNGKGFYKQKFELVNDLVILPVELNGEELSFLLDTGINTTILFNYGYLDSTAVNNTSVIYLKGLGAGKPARAIKSSNNSIRFGEISGRNQTLYVISGEAAQISKRLGVVVNGVLGYDFFKDLIVEFNYKRKFLKAYTPESYKYRKCRRCIDVPVNFHENKPYITLKYSDSLVKDNEVVLLVDSGSSDAVWLFPDKERKIEIPEKSFTDFLGFGISGSIYGERSRIESLEIGKYTLREVNSSYPQSVYLTGVKSFEERDGSIGSQILRRFHLVIDYPAENFRFKPNSDFGDPFEYDKSGVVVEQIGYQVVKNEARNSSPVTVDGYRSETEGEKVYESAIRVQFSLEPAYAIGEIRPGSSAEMAGLQVGDELLEINGRPAYKFDLDHIREIFSSKEGKKIRLVLLREGEEIKVSFRLQSIL